MNIISKNLFQFYLIIFVNCKTLFHSAIKQTGFDYQLFWAIQLSLLPIVPTTNQIAQLSASFAELGPAQP